MTEEVENATDDWELEELLGKKGTTVDREEVQVSHWSGNKGEDVVDMVCGCEAWITAQR